MTPTFRLLQFVSCEIQRVDLCFRQVVSSCDVSLWLEFWESRQGINNFLLPRPGHQGTQMWPHFVCGASGVCPFLCGGLFVNPIQKLADFFSSQLVNWYCTAPTSPSSEGRGVLLARLLLWISRTEVLRNYGFESQ